MRVSLLFSLLHEKETFKSLFVRAASLARVLRPPPANNNNNNEKKKKKKKKKIYIHIYI